MTKKEETKQNKYVTSAPKNKLYFCILLLLLFFVSDATKSQNPISLFLIFSLSPNQSRFPGIGQLIQYNSGAQG